MMYCPTPANPQLTALANRLRTARRTLDRQYGQAQTIAHTGTRLQADITDLTTRIDDYTRAAAVLTSIGEQRQATAQTQIETLVTRGLQTIFDDDLTFHVNPVIRGNRPEIDFVVRSTLDGHPVDTPVMDARGGGLAATVGALLRIVILLLTQPEPLLCLDETFAHVSAAYEPRWAEFLRDLVDNTGMQILMITHSDAFTDLADTRYRFTLTNAVTHVSTG
jgi:hypothetical protein